MTVTLHPDELYQPIASWLQRGDYGSLAVYCEQAITAYPTCTDLYWYLGLALLLQGQEVEAQMSWLLGIEASGAESSTQALSALIQILTTEATRQESQENWSMAWAIRQHIREIAADDRVNILHLVHCSLHTSTFSGNSLRELGIIDSLTPEDGEQFTPDALISLLKQIFAADPYHEAVFAFAEVCLRCLPHPQAYIADLVDLTLMLAHTRKRPDLAITLAESYLAVDGNNLNMMRPLTAHYQDAGLLEKGIDLAQRCYELSPTLPEQIFANHMLIRGLLATGGRWFEGRDLLQRQEALLRTLLQSDPATLSLDQGAAFLTNSTFFFPYLQDTPQVNQHLRSEVMHYFQQVVEHETKLLPNENNYHWQRRAQIVPPEGRSEHQAVTANKPLKIGYLSHCLISHSVGWLMRWLIQHHDRDLFELYGYFINYRQTDDFLQAWYTQKITNPRPLGMNAGEIASQIYQDEIDILVDLDSLTLDVACQVLAAKPAPVQVTWLGWDASGLPAIDYFIADPYVLPENAQEYYHEKIWRLPQTYIAVDGFEVSVPSLRRDELELPTDAVIYFTGQRGYKWNPETTRLQLQILQAVPHSYFLIKGLTSEAVIQDSFCEIAEQVGVSRDRLRFLPPAPTEAIHRANLGIADVVLDTYPYNGATTTLETLWMGVPLVTRVGQQFAARNSYTMLVNVGIEEGIAWTDEEYIEWGIRFGTEPELRQQVSWKLKQSRQTAPLWNARQFARDMETAYQQMWEKYCSCQSS